MLVTQHNAKVYRTDRTSCYFRLHSTDERRSVTPQYSAVLVTNLCVSCPLHIIGKVKRAVGGAADKEACTVHPTSIISQRQYFTAFFLNFWVVMSLVYIIYACPFNQQASDVGETHSLVPATVQSPVTTPTTLFVPDLFIY
jgi:hypothetical protein